MTSRGSGSSLLGKTWATSTDALAWYAIGFLPPWHSRTSHQLSAGMGASAAPGTRSSVFGVTGVNVWETRSCRLAIGSGDRDRGRTEAGKEYSNRSACASAERDERPPRASAAHARARVT